MIYSFILYQCKGAEHRIHARFWRTPWVLRYSCWVGSLPVCLRFCWNHRALSSHLGIHHIDLGDWWYTIPGMEWSSYHTADMITSPSTGPLHSQHYRVGLPVTSLIKSQVQRLLRYQLTYH